MAGNIGIILEMYDELSLNRWIQPQHLGSHTIKNYHHAFTIHPARMIVIRRFLREEVAQKLGQFITTEAQYETLYGLYSAMRKNSSGLANVTEAEWNEAEEKERFFRLHKFVCLPPERQLTPSLMMYLMFQATFNGSDFRGFFEQLIGLSLDYKTSTFHAFVMKRGDCLGWHHDDNDKYAWLSSCTYPRAGNPILAASFT